MTHRRHAHLGPTERKKTERKKDSRIVELGYSSLSDLVIKSDSPANKSIYSELYDIYPQIDKTKLLSKLFRYNVLFDLLSVPVTGTSVSFEVAHIDHLVDGERKKFNDIVVSVKKQFVVNRKANLGFIFPSKGFSEKEVDTLKGIDFYYPDSSIGEYSKAADNYTETPIRTKSKVAFSTLARYNPVDHVYYPYSSWIKDLLITALRSNNIENLIKIALYSSVSQSVSPEDVYLLINRKTNSVVASGVLSYSEQKKQYSLTHILAHIGGKGLFSFYHRDVRIQLLQNVYRVLLNNENPLLYHKEDLGW